MQKTVSVGEATTQLSELISLALQGNEIILTDADKPVVRLVPIPASTGERIPGLNRGEIWISADFDEPLPDEFWLGVS